MRSLLGGTVTGDAEVKNYAPTLAVTTAQVRNEKPGEGCEAFRKRPAQDIGQHFPCSKVMRI